MITVQLKGGLGNQLFQYSFAKMMYLKFGINYNFDLSFFKKNTQCKYELPSIGINTSINTEQSITSRIFRDLDKYMKYLPSFGNIIIEPRNGNILQKKLIDNAYYSGYWQNIDYFDDYKQKIVSDINFSLPDNVSSFINSLNINSCCAVHIRRGDYFSTKRNMSLFNTLSDNYYQFAESEMIKKVKLDKLIVFSNDYDWVKQNIIFKTPVEYMDRFTSKPSEDLLIMSLLKHKIIPNSTFSWWAAYIGELQGSITIVPKKWGNGPYLSRINIYPSNWVKV